MIRKFLVVILLLVSPLALYGANPTTSDKPPFVVDGYLSHEMLVKVVKKGSISIPQLRVYDHTGRIIRDFGKGFAETGFVRELMAIVANPKAPTSRARLLPAELNGLVDSNGSPLRASADRDLIFVEYWAKWCQPCHAQYEALVRFLESQKSLKFTLFHVALTPHPNGKSANKT